MAEFEGLIPGGQYLDKCTEQAREWERPQPLWLRAMAREQAQRWRDLRWRMWDGPR